MKPLPEILVLALLFCASCAEMKTEPIDPLTPAQINQVIPYIDQRIEYHEQQKLQQQLQAPKFKLFSMEAKPLSTGEDYLIFSINYSNVEIAAIQFEVNGMNFTYESSMTECADINFVHQRFYLQQSKEYLYLCMKIQVSADDLIAVKIWNNNTLLAHPTERVNACYPDCNHTKKNNQQISAS